MMFNFLGNFFYQSVILKVYSKIMKKKLHKVKHVARSKKNFIVRQ